MRIAMLSWESLHSIAVGGVAAHVTELAAALARRDHQIHVFTRRAYGQAGHDWTDGVHYHRCTYSPCSDFVDDINSMCRSFVDRVFEVEDMVGRFDVIHAHDWLTANAMIWIRQDRGHKCLFTIHSTEYGRCGNAFSMGRSERIRYQERAGTYWADRVIAVSLATKDEISWMYEVPRWKTSVVHNGVSPERFDQPTDPGTDKRRYHIGPLDPTILFCGRLSWQKGPDILVEAIPPILRQHPSSRFVFVGDGDMRDVLESRIRQLGVTHAVRFLGYRNGDELVRLYKLAEVVCMPSRNEPFGIVVLEAWSAGKPVLASQNGGPAEYVRHEVNGLKIYPNPDSVAWGVDRMFSDFTKARWMGENGRRAVQERFTWDTITEQMVDIYRGLCRNPAMPAHRAADSLKAVLAASSREASWAGALKVDSLAIIDVKGACGPHTQVQATLHFAAADIEEEVDDAMTAWESYLARSGLIPQREDRTLIVRGGRETIVAGLKLCDQHMRRTRVCHSRPPSIEMAAVPREALADDLVCAAPQECTGGTCQCVCHSRSSLGLGWMKGDPMARARIGDTVKVHYEGRLDDGTVFASSIDRDPAELTIGAHGAIPRFAEAIVGMEPDECKTIRIPVTGALEQHRGEPVPTITPESFAAALEPQVGQKLQAIDTDERSSRVTAWGVSKQPALVDANHPLAGGNLTFDILLVEIV